MARPNSVTNQTSFAFVLSRWSQAIAGGNSNQGAQGIVSAEERLQPWSHRADTALLLEQTKGQ